MLHHSLKLQHYKPSDALSSAHWAVGKNDTCILLQTDDGREQARISLTPEEALEVAMSIIEQVRDFNMEAQLEQCR